MNVKPLETEFTLNADKRGDNVFKQIKRNEFAALYRRFLPDGTPLEYEVFQIKIAGGTEVFGRFYEKYEQYPGANAFGRTAWSVGNLSVAEKIYNEITVGRGSRYDGQTAILNGATEVAVRPARTGRKGRVAAIRPELVFPKKRFVMDELWALNTKGWTKPTVYVALRKCVEQKKVKVVGSKPNGSGRGKPLVIYEKV